MRGSIYWVLLFQGRFFATKPLSQIQKSTLWPLQDANPTPSLGGFGLRLIIRNSIKSAAIASIFVLIFFAYGPVHDYLWVHRASIGGLFVGRHTFLLPIAAALALASVPLVLLYRRSLEPLMRVAAAGVIILIMFNIGQIAVDAVGQGGDSSIDIHPLGSAFGTGSNGIDLPDIYYIILDGYARADVLKEVYNFDNSEFIESLTRKGFFVAAESRSNYIFTKFSLPSSLNMRYLEEGERVWQSVADSAVLHVVQNLGYQYVHLDSGWGKTRRNKHADVEFLGDRPLQLLLNEYSAVLLKSTMFGPVPWWLGFNFLNSPLRPRQPSSLEKTWNISKRYPALPIRLSLLTTTSLPIRPTYLTKMGINHRSLGSNSQGMSGKPPTCILTS